MIFTRRKFLSLPRERQHKKLALLLRAGEKDLYRTYASWIEVPEFSLETHKEISDAFHYHAREACLEMREHNLLPNPKTRDGDVREVLPYYVYLDNLRSAFNVGSIIRTAECFGFSKVFFSKDTPNHLSSKVQKSAMGTEKWIECEIAPEILPRPLIVLETVETAPSIFDFKFPESFTLVLGNEEYGVSDKLLESADHFVRIPMRGRKGSLNVANAFAIAGAVISSRLTLTCP